MAKSENQKKKLLYILKMFYERTDEQHTITVKDIINELESHGITADRRSIYDDIQTLEEFGIEIIRCRSKGCGYFLADRLFEDAELKILVDVIQSSRFITKRKSAELIKKIEKLTSKPQANTLHRELYISDRVKSINECIYYNVDTIHNAISQNRKIAFKYFEYNLKRECVFRKDGRYYITNPLALTFDSENYYLIVYDDKYCDNTHYRVDKMADIRILDEKRVLPKQNFNVASYVNKIFGMYTGEEAEVTALFYKNFLNVIIDRFGDNVTLMEYDEDEDWFVARFKVNVSPVFLSWMIGFGDNAKILSPDWVAESMLEMIYETLSMYEDYDE